MNQDHRIGSCELIALKAWDTEFCAEIMNAREIISLAPVSIHPAPDVRSIIAQSFCPDIATLENHMIRLLSRPYVLPENEHRVA
jgi:hypothetical protein